jgi:hypothetical protein
MQTESRTIMHTFSNLNFSAANLGYMAAAKTGDPVMGRYLQMLLREWVAAETGRTDADFVRLSGLSRGTVNNIKNKAEGAGRQTVEKFAAALGKTAGALYAAGDRWHRTGTGELGPEDRETELDEGDSGSRYGELPGWRQAEIEARKLFSDVPDFAFRLAAGMHGGAVPEVIDARTVGELASGAWRVSGFRARIEAETTQAKENLERQRELKRALADAEAAERDRTPQPTSATRAKKLTPGAKARKG